MPRILSADLLTHLSEESTQVTTCVQITPIGITPIYLTDHDEDIVIGAITYSAASGYNRSAIQSTDTLETGSVVLEGILDSESIDVQKILSGAYDYSPAKMLIVNYADTAIGVADLLTGTVGEIEIRTDLSYRAEMLDLKHYLSNVIGEVYTLECRADLGDSRCKVPITNPTWGRIATVTTVTNRNTFIVSFDNPDARAAQADWYQSGSLRWNTGDNVGKAHEITVWESGTNAITMYLSSFFTIQVGDTLTVYPGCDKTITTCIDRFDNRLNFRGEPFLPGRDILGKYGDRPPTIGLA